jgi:Flp pilus assembly protein CpaB
MKGLSYLLLPLVGSWVTATACMLVMLPSDRQLAELRRPEDTVMVMVAAQDLLPGEPITEQQFFAIQIPPRFLPPQVFLDADQLTGRRVAEPIFTDEFIHSERLQAR